MRLTLKEQSECGMLCPEWQNHMAWEVMSGLTKTVWDVMSGMTKQHGMLCPGWQIFVGCFVQGVKNGMGCFVPGCFVRLPKSVVR